MSPNTLGVVGPGILNQVPRSWGSTRILGFQMFERSGGVWGPGFKLFGVRFWGLLRLQVLGCSCRAWGV